MTFRLLDYDPLSGMKTLHGYDESTDTTIIRYEEDVEGVLDACKEDSNHADRSLKAPMVHVATVPPSIQMKWFVELGVKMWDRNDRGKVNALLDGDYKYLKRLPIYIGNH